MEYNTHWKVAVRGEEHTYPMENKLVLIYVDSNLTPCIFYNHAFRKINSKQSIKVINFNTPIFWQYVDLLPNQIKVHNVVKCGKKTCDCEFIDDGYCFDKPSEIDCGYRRVRTEYYAYNE